MVNACSDFVTELIEQAAACITEKDSQAEKKLRALVNYWAVNQLLSVKALSVCQTSVDEALLLAQAGPPNRRRDYLLPEYHGDRGAHWTDLPASYMLDPMIKHRERPIYSEEIKIRKLDERPVTEYVRNLLDNFFENIDLKYVPTGDNPTGETEWYKLSLDPMGQIVKQDKETGDKTTVANGYGWSMKLCEDMQENSMPENIRIAREGFERMRREDLERLRAVRDTRPRPQERGDNERRPSSSAESDHRRSRKARTHSSSYSRSRSPGYRNRDSSSSFDRSRSRNGTQGRGKISPKPTRRTGSEDRGQRYDTNQPTQPGQQWNVPTGPSGNARGSAGNIPYSNSPMPVQNYVQPQIYGQAYSQPPQVPFNAPPFAPQMPLPGQFHGTVPMSMLPFVVPPPPPPQVQGPGGSIPPPPPPPPNWNPAQPPNINAVPNGPHYGGQYGGQYGGNNLGFGNNAQYGQNQGGAGGFGGQQGQRGGYVGQQGQRGGNGGQQGQQGGYGGQQGYQSQQGGYEGNQGQQGGFGGHHGQQGGFGGYRGQRGGGGHQRGDYNANRGGRRGTGRGGRY